MTSQQVRQAFLDYALANGHAIIPRANLVPQNDPTTLFTGSGMQPLVQYFLGETHPKGKRIADSQTCFRADDIEEVGDNRHMTFFEMLGNWSFGDYFKQEQLNWLFGFLVNDIGLDPAKLYVTCFIGDKQSNVDKDSESAKIWQQLFNGVGIKADIVELGTEQDGARNGMQGGRIFYYDASKNWWSRSGTPSNMPTGEPGGPDSEVFYEFTHIEHDPKFGKNCHPNCDCGRFLEIGNSVFMQYKKLANGTFAELPARNVDFGGGLERISAASNDDPDIFKISVIWPIIERLEALSGQKYTSHTNAMRVIADHMRAATFLAVDSVTPSNKGQGYVMRRILRRAIRYAFEIGVEQGMCEHLAPVVVDIYKNDFTEVSDAQEQVVQTLIKEEKVFRQTLRNGLRQFDNYISKSKSIDGEIIFALYDTYGFPVELTKEEAYKRGVDITDSADAEFNTLMQQQRDRSRTATKGDFKGGLADASEFTTKLHTAAHLLDAALHQVLGEGVVQRGSNINADRLRFDFSHPQKVTADEITKSEELVNQAIADDLPVTWSEQDTKEALASGAIGAFGHQYPDKVKVYVVGDPNQPFSREICGGPHVQRTGQLAEGGKKFKITKEEASSAGVRRIKAILK
jgi:alanyl-tRNA synthetase